MAIREENFGTAGEKIKEYQDSYKEQYDRRMKVLICTLRGGSRIQCKVMRSKRRKGAKNKINWKPINRFYKIHTIDRDRKSCTLFDPETQKVFKRNYSLDYVRRFIRR